MRKVIKNKFRIIRDISVEYAVLVVFLYIRHILDSR
jgi:hypothetical protein